MQIEAAAADRYDVSIHFSPFSTTSNRNRKTKQKRKSILILKADKSASFNFYEFFFFLFLQIRKKVGFLLCFLGFKTYNARKEALLTL